MDTRTVAAAMRSRVHHTVFKSLTLPPKHSRVRLKPAGTWWRTGGEVKGKLVEWVASTLKLPWNVAYPALLMLMHTPRLPAVNWTDAPTNLNGLVCFGKTRNLVSAWVPSRFKHSPRTLCYAAHPLKILEHPCHYVGFQTAIDPMVSLTNLLTFTPSVCSIQCDPLVIHNKVIPHFVFQLLMKLNFLRVSLRLHCQHITLVHHYLFRLVRQVDFSAKAAFWPRHWLR
jgi:hypothetical protein